MKPVEEFAREAARFRDWARDDIGSGEVAVREALVRLSALYTAGLRLPPVGEMTAAEEEVDPSEPPFWVGAEELEAVAAKAAALPVGYYQETLELEPQRPEVIGMGDLQDDIGDIYADVVRGLRVFEAGWRQAAHQEWTLHFRIHWGVHSTSAMRALHQWLLHGASGRGATPVESQRTARPGAAASAGTAHERSFLESGLLGWSVLIGIAGAIGVLVPLAVSIYAGSFEWSDFGLGAVGLGVSVMLWLGSRVARAARPPG